jgi:predicted RNA-binding protein with RPS1 domain
VHPERYELVDRIAADLGCSVLDLLRDGQKRAKIQPDKYVTTEVGLPTLKDILAELAKPGRDPRQNFEAFSFAEGVEKMEDLQPGLRLPGIVTNVTAFGAFVDIGVHQDGLVHISQMSDEFVKNPADVLKVGQRVQATVMEVDMGRKRIALSLKTKVDLTPRDARPKNAANDRDVRKFQDRSNSPGGGGGSPRPMRKRPPIGSRSLSRRRTRLQHIFLTALSAAALRLLRRRNDIVEAGTRERSRRIDNFNRAGSRSTNDILELGPCRVRKSVLVPHRIASVRSSLEADPHPDRIHQVPSRKRTPTVPWVCPRDELFQIAGAISIDVACPVCRSS